MQNLHNNYILKVQSCQTWLGVLTGNFQWLHLNVNEMFLRSVENLIYLPVIHILFTWLFLVKYMSDIFNNSNACQIYSKHSIPFILFKIRMTEKHSIRGIYIAFFHFSIDATHSTGAGRMANDSPYRFANAEMKIVYCDDKPFLCLFARRYIHANVEIRYDYGVPNLPWRKLTVSYKVLFLSIGIC